MQWHPLTPSDNLAQRLRVLEQQLSDARAEAEALRVARDAALRISAWGGPPRRQRMVMAPELPPVEREIGEPTARDWAEWCAPLSS
jgi:hypothetical protein